MLGALLRRPHALRRLQAVHPTGHSGHYAGLQEVELAAIRGSEGRSTDFDDAFCPLTAATRQHWERIARALGEGVWLPPVVLIQVGDEYFVRDGHHRISVYAALGRFAIQAEVTLWASDAAL